MKTNKPVVHYKKLETPEPFVVIQENCIGDERWLREVPVSNLQDRNGDISVKFGGGWYPLAGAEWVALAQIDAEHAALVAVAEAAGKLLADHSLCALNDKALKIALANLSAVRAGNLGGAENSSCFFANAGVY